MKYNGSSEIRHIIEFLSKEFGPEKIKDAIKRPLELKVALHYGCHLIKPSKERDLGTVERLVEQSINLYKMLKKETRQHKKLIRYLHVETAQYGKIGNLFNVFADGVKE